MKSLMIELPALDRSGAWDIIQRRKLQLVQRSRLLRRSKAGAALPENARCGKTGENAELKPPLGGALQASSPAASSAGALCAAPIPRRRDHGPLSWLPEPPKQESESPHSDLLLLYDRLPRNLPEALDLLRELEASA